MIKTIDKGKGCIPQKKIYKVLPLSFFSINLTSAPCFTRCANTMIPTIKIPINF